MLLATLGGLAALSWSPEKPLRLGTGILVPAVFKGLTISWCPLLLMKPVKWRTLGLLAATTLALNGIVLGLAGPAVYADFFTRMLPETLRQPLFLNISLAAMIGKLGLGVPPSVLTGSLYLTGVLAVYIGFSRKARTAGPAALANCCAALVALVVLFNLFNKLVWGHYISLFIPFWGWALWEYAQGSRRGQKRLMLWALACGVLFPTTNTFVGWFLLQRLNVVTALYQGTIVGVELLFLTLAYRRLFWLESGPRPTSTADGAEAVNPPATETASPIPRSASRLFSTGMLANLRTLCVH
jgi:hypothetical protein